MSKLIFNLKYVDVKFPTYLEEHFGKSFADGVQIESTQTAKEHQAKVLMLDFKMDKNLIDKLKQDENVSSVFLVDDKEVISTIK